MSRDFSTQTESNGKNKTDICHALIQAGPEEKSCFREKVYTGHHKKTITPLFWIPAPKNRRFKNGKVAQTQRDFWFQDKFTQVVESDFVNKRSKIIESTDRKNDAN